MNEVHILHGFDGMPPSVCEGATQLCDTCARMTKTKTKIEFRKCLFSINESICLSEAESAVPRRHQLISINPKSIFFQKGCDSFQ